MDLSMLKRVIGFIIFYTFVGSALAVDNENLSSIRSCSIYEVGRTGRYIQSFVGVPGLASGLYIAERVALNYDVWHYGAMYDRSSTELVENWDDRNDSSHIRIFEADTTHVGGASFFWKYDYIYSKRADSNINVGKRYWYDEPQVRITPHDKGEI